MYTVAIVSFGAWWLELEFYRVFSCYALQYGSLRSMKLL